MQREKGYLMDPHTAVAWKVAEDLQTGPAGADRLDGALEQVRRRRRARTERRAGDGEPLDEPDDFALLDRVVELAPGARIPASLEAVRARPARFDTRIAGRRDDLERALLAWLGGGVTGGMEGGAGAGGRATTPGRAGGGAQGLVDSAPRRTYLAAERTYLAWLRTGLGALGLSLAVGRLIPALIDSSHVAFAVLGVGYGAAGRSRGVRAPCASGACVARSSRRAAAVRRLDRDRAHRRDLALAAFTIVLVLVEV